MATVYLARTTGGIGSHRFVALKVLHPHLTGDSQFVAMFLDEVEIASRIRHVNVCSVFDYGVRDGLHYLAMEYVAGETLRALWRKLAREQQEPTRLLSHVAQMLAGACEGLHAAHELTDHDDEPLEVVHRDVSPENLFLTYDGTAKLVDFGVASAIRKRHHTRTGIVKGKYSYLAPEVLLARKPDRRADVWGIGVIAWELLTGRRLFHRGTDVETLRAVTDANIPPPSKLRPGLPQAADAIILRALARNPEKRYPTARALGHDLAQLAIRSGHAVTEASLGQWLEELFPRGRSRHQQMMRVADQSGEYETLDPPAVEKSPPMDNATLLAAPPTSFSETKLLRPMARPALWAVGLAAALGVGALLGAYVGHGGPPPLSAGPVPAMPAARAEPPPGVQVQSGGPNEIIIRVLLSPGDAVCTQQSELEAAVPR